MTKPFQPSRQLSQEEWRVILRSTVYFFLGMSVIIGVMAFLLGWILSG